MPKVNVLLLATILAAATSLTSCSDSNGGDSVELKDGQSAITLRLSGGHLKDPLEFSGTADKTMDIFSTSMTYLGTGLNFTASNSTAVLKQMVVSMDTSEAGTYPTKAGDSDMVFSFPDEGKGYSMKPRDGGGTIKIERLEGEHVRIHFDFDASPTNISSKELIFHIEGVLETRPRAKRK